MRFLVKNHYPRRITRLHGKIPPAGRTVPTDGMHDGGSSNGRTTDSGSVDRGSNPLPSACWLKTKRPFQRRSFYLIEWVVVTVTFLEASLWKACKEGDSHMYPPFDLAKNICSLSWQMTLFHPLRPMYYVYRDNGWVYAPFPLPPRIDLSKSLRTFPLLPHYDGGIPQ